MGISPLFYDKGVIIIESNIIYNFEDLKTILINKTKKGSYYLLKDDIYFEEISSDTVITREVLTEAKRILKRSEVIKYITFSTKEKYSPKQVFELVQLLGQKTNIIVTIFNLKEKECNLIFISNEDDFLIEHYIQEFLELEVL